MSVINAPLSTFVPFLETVRLANGHKPSSLHCGPDKVRQAGTGARGRWARGRQNGAGRHCRKGCGRVGTGRGWSQEALWPNPNRPPSVAWSALHRLFIFALAISMAQYPHRGGWSFTQGKICPQPQGDLRVQDDLGAGYAQACQLACPSTG